ncbi:MAG: DUF1592 domain-containing protein, partial [Verrucomicrobiota bacterium]
RIVLLLGLLVCQFSATAQSDFKSWALPKTKFDKSGGKVMPMGAEVTRVLKGGHALSISVWIKTADLRQEGPARIVSISKNINERNFTLGQEGDEIDVRLRTTKTSKNGMPSLASKAKLKTDLIHVVYTFGQRGDAKLFLDGRAIAQRRLGGDLSNWDDGFTLILGDEKSGGRAWKGELLGGRIYAGELSSDQIQRLYQGGVGSVDLPEAPKVDENEALFTQEVAPILATHCLECHEPSLKKGDLDLTTAAAAASSLVAGNSAESLLWESVENDDMPHKRPPLSDQEKATLKRWIDGGAKWSLGQVDPANYTHSSRNTRDWVRRLTRDEYIATVRATLGVDVSAETLKWFPPDFRADGFRNTSYNLTVDFKHVEAFAKLAEAAVAKVDIPAFGKRFSRDRSVTKRMRDGIEAMGKWVLRGSISEEEVSIYRGIATSVVSAGGDYDDALAMMLEAMLQSPRFLYRVEFQKGTGDRFAASDYEIASRLSYLIWGASPDAELFQLAETGRLSSQETLRKQAVRMLEDKRAVDRSFAFLGQWLNLSRLENLNPDSDHFPNWDPALAADMRSETLAFFEEVVWQQQRPLSDLMNAQVTFLTPALAEHYGLTYQGQSKHDLVEIPERGGLFTQASVLTIGGDEASMVTRGLFVLHDVLRGVVKDPPPGVDTTPVSTKPGVSQRVSAEERIADKSCGGCHSKFEPLAFALEKYDSLGVFAERDRHGNSLRSDGEALIPMSDKGQVYSDVATFLDILSRSSRVKETLTWKLTQFAIGRPLGPNDVRAVETIHADAMSGGGTYQATIRAIAVSDFIRFTSTEPRQ